MRTFLGTIFQIYLYVGGEHILLSSKPSILKDSSILFSVAEKVYPIVILNFIIAAFQEADHI